MLREAGDWLRRGSVLAAAVCALLLGGCGSGVRTAVTPTAPVSPTGIAGITFSPSSLDFGTVPTGTISPTQTVTLTSSGTAPLMITSIAATGDYAFAAITCPSSPVTIAVGTTCTLTLQFSPFATGTRPGALVLTSNVPGTTSTVPLTGVGGSTSDTVSPTALAFGSLPLGTTSAVQSVTITATGTTPLIVSSLVVSGDFARPATNCNATLAAGASCIVNLTFTPTVAAARTGTLTIGSSTGNSPQVVSLSGVGTVPPTVSGVPLTVKVQAGSAPVAGASVQLYAAGAAGARTGAAALLAKGVTTDATGTAALSGYTCPTAATPVYLLASGGAVGAAGANGNSLLMTAVGPCGGIASGTSYVVNEITSVAAVYALQQFYAAGGVVGASASNLTGITNAFGTAAQMIDPTTGALPANFPTTATLASARLNSIANAVNACLVNVAQCSALYGVTAGSGAQAANTLDALFSLARQPAANVAGVYTQAQLSSAYAPALASAPSDWTIFLTYTGGGLNSPSGIAVDSTGSVWVANYFYIASKFTPQGVPVFPIGLTGVGINNSYGIAIDLNDDIWIPNEQPYTNYGIGSVTVLTPPGGFISGYGFQQGGLSYPLAVAIDPNATTWVVDYGNSHVTLLNSLGTPLSGVSGYTTPLFAFPVAVAIDANHFGWIANQSSNTVTKVAPDGSSFTNYTCCVGASGIALDQGNNVWVANFSGDSVSLISNAGTVLGNASYTGNGGISRPQGIALDGAGNVWVANYRRPFLTELAGLGSATASVGASLTPSTGYGADAKLLEAYALALDASGNLWVSNQGSNTITKFVGLAAPVKTPLSGLPVTP